MVAKVTWKGGLDFNGDAKSGFSLDLSASAKVGGSEDGFRPMELMALGLAGCAAMDVMSILQKKRQHITDFEVHVHPEFADKHPYVWTQVQIEYRITGKDINPKAVERAIELSFSKYCPAYNMLNDSITFDSIYQIVEADTVVS
ncbi:MAG: OsmC family protein [Chloroflexi bacterium]|nr:OsmC family protein [Chloroflexota bacterium]